jgi:hypothetical protein
MGVAILLLVVGVAGGEVALSCVVALVVSLPIRVVVSRGLLEILLLNVVGRRVGRAAGARGGGGGDGEAGPLLLLLGDVRHGVVMVGYVVGVCVRPA